jgi:hypothetical protein
MSERITAWRCIGCGRLEAAQPCIGVCQDRPVDLVFAADHEEALAQLAAARSQAEALVRFVREVAYTTPRQGEWERTYRALQRRARAALRAMAKGVRIPDELREEEGPAGRGAGEA